MENARLTFLFYKYINRMCSEAERLELLDLLGHPQHQAQVRKILEEVWNEIPEGLPHERSEKILHTILSQDACRPLSGTHWGRMAAIFIIALLCVAGVLIPRAPFFKDDAALTASKTKVSLPSFMKLPDGSTVILNRGSRLKFDEPFDQESREVYLEGEGFFDIVEDADRPFIVHTGKLRTTVLGTAFNIRAWPEQDSVVVTVKRGRVKVGDDRETLAVVNPDQQVSFDRTPRRAKPTPVDSRQVISWIEKDIFFDNVTMADAIDQLVSRFDVPVSISNAQIGDCRFTATFVKGESFVQILTILCEFNNASLSPDGKSGYVVVGGACPAVSEASPEGETTIQEPNNVKL